MICVKIMKLKRKIKTIQKEGAIKNLQHLKKEMITNSIYHSFLSFTKTKALLIKQLPKNNRKIKVRFGQKMEFQTKQIANENRIIVLFKLKKV